MQEEKPNESFHWKNKLDELDYLPGEPVRDKSVSWDKLHDRLRKKTQYNKSLWYWIAAACVLLLLTGGFPWLSTNQKNDKIVIHKKQSTPQQSANKPEKVNEEYAVVNPTDTTSEKEKKQGTRVSAKKEKHYVTKDVVPVEKYIIPDTSIVKEPLPEIIVSIPTSSDTIHAIAAAPLKKKLRVVHINELGKQVEGESQYARIISSNVLQGKLFNRDDMSSFSLTRNASDNFIKIKLSPSN